MLKGQQNIEAAYQFDEDQLDHENFESISAHFKPDFTAYIVEDRVIFACNQSQFTFIKDGQSILTKESVPR